MVSGGGLQVRFQPQRMEKWAGVELSGQIRLIGGRGVNLRKRMSHLTRKARVGDAVTQLLFPDRMPVGFEKRHDEQLVGLAVCDQRRHDLGCDAGDGLQPSKFEAVALDRRFPDLAHLQTRQRTLDAHRAAPKIHPPDIRGHAARERYQINPLAGSNQSEASQRLQDVSGGLRGVIAARHGSVTQTRSKTAAIPCPPPMHMVTRA